MNLRLFWLSLTVITLGTMQHALRAWSRVGEFSSRDLVMMTPFLLVFDAVIALLMLWLPTLIVLCLIERYVKWQTTAFGLIVLLLYILYSRFVLTRDSVSGTTWTTPELMIESFWNIYFPIFLMLQVWVYFKFKS